MTEPPDFYETPPAVFSSNVRGRIGYDVCLPSGQVAHRTPVRSREAFLLADLYSLIEDLKRCLELCRRLDAQDLDPLVSSAAWEAAVMAYARCFKNGVSARGKGQRRRIPAEVLQARTPVLVQAHQKIIKQHRDEHIAHRVGGDEGVVVQALREEATGPVVGLHIWGIRMMRPENPRELGSLAEDLLSRLQPIYAAEGEALLEQQPGGS